MRTDHGGVAGRERGDRYGASPVGGLDAYEASSAWWPVPLRGAPDEGTMGSW